jgi:Cyclic nucleotide-binding domain
VGGEIGPAASDGRLGGLGGRVPGKVWHALLANGTPRRYVKGEALVRQGEFGRHVLALNYGLVKVTRLELDGHEMVLAVRGRGEIIGESTYLGDQARSATVTAIHVCITYIVPHLTFRRIVEEFGLGSLVLRHLTDRLRESEEMRSELASLPPRRRIARLLRLGLLRLADVASYRVEHRMPGWPHGGAFLGVPCANIRSMSPFSPSLSNSPSTPAPVTRAVVPPPTTVISAAG